MTRETPALFAQSASVLAPFLSVQTCLCSPLESRFASSLPLDNIYPNGLFHKSFFNLVLSCGLTAKPGPEYPFHWPTGDACIAERQVTRKDEGDHGEPDRPSNRVGDGMQLRCSRRLVPSPDAQWFIPPFVRPISLPRPPFLTAGLRPCPSHTCFACAVRQWVCFEVSRVD